MRKVMTYKYDHGKVEDGVGVFIQYGADYEEFSAGPGNYTTAIVEMPNGTVKNLPVTLIRFIEPIGYVNR